MKQQKKERIPLRVPGRECGSFGGWSAERTEQLSIAINEKLSPRQEIWFSRHA